MKKNWGKLKKYYGFSKKSNLNIWNRDFGGREFGHTAGVALEETKPLGYVGV